LKKTVTFRRIKRYSSGAELIDVEDPMVVEVGLDIFIDEQFYKKIYCSPIYIDELVIGSLAFDNMIDSVKDIAGMQIEDDRVHVSLLMAEQENLKSYSDSDVRIQVEAHTIALLMKQHLDSSDIHKKTGGVHIMSLSDGQGLMVSREDIGRHNAVDKLYGYCLKNGVDCGSKIFLSSGRISYEMIEKIWLMGIKIIVSRATVTDLARKRAEDTGITLIGFARGERFNIYSHPERIIINDRG